MADEGARRRMAAGAEGAEAAYRRIPVRKLAERGFSGAALEREVDRLLAVAGTMRLGGGRAPRGSRCPDEMRSAVGPAPRPAP